MNDNSILSVHRRPPSPTGFAASPIFSVIVPCWNAAATLEDTLASLFNQTFSDWEAILVNDGSVDGTGDILASWTARDPRFHAFDLPNGGPSRARNYAALEFANGKYLAFLDADDLWAPNKLQVMSDILARRSEVDGLYARVAFFRDSPTTSQTTSQILPGRLSPMEMLGENAVCTMSNLVLRADRFRASNGFDPSLSYSEDLEWLVRVTANGAVIEGVDKVLVYYRSSDEGLSVNLDRMHSGWRSVIAAARKAGIALSLRDVRRAESIHLRQLSRRALRVRVPRFTALRFAVRGIICSPSAFFGDPWRGGMTLLAASIEPVMPSALRRIAFAL